MIKVTACKERKGQNDFPMESEQQREREKGIIIKLREVRKKGRDQREKGISGRSHRN